MHCPAADLKDQKTHRLRSAGNSIGANNTVIVETIHAHESGQWIQSELCMPLAKNDPQGVGSAITYGRRYGLAAIVGIVADDDDDGNAASAKDGNGNVRQTPQNQLPQNQRPVAVNQSTRGPISVR